MKKLFLVIVFIAIVGTVVFYQQGFYKKIFATKDKSKFVWGIDISHHQKNIDYDALLKGNKPAFVLMKSTEGRSYIDNAYAERLKKFRSLNIPVGAFHFFSYDVSGRSQAENFIKTASLQKGDLFPVLDVEFKGSGRQSEKWIVGEIKSFCDRIKEEFGIQPIIYCEYDYYRKYLKTDFSDYQYWISDFYREPRCNYVIWQYDTLNVDGFAGKIDNDRLADGVELKNIILK